MFLSVGMVSVADSEISLSSAMIAGPAALLIAFLSSVSLLTILSGAPDAKGENPLNSETKQEDVKVIMNSKETKIKALWLRRQREPSLDLTFISITGNLCRATTTKLIR
jgi:hypothetical protein